MPRDSLSPARIVDAAYAMIVEHGLEGLSMRRLGDRLGVDAMAAYRHVGNKQALLASVLARALADMGPVDETALWNDRVRAWATAYWDLATQHRELIAAALADPMIARGARPAMRPLTEALRISGLDDDLVEANAYLIVDFIHGSALGNVDPQRVDTNATTLLRSWFEIGLSTIMVGIEHLARPPT